jgi:hypothetical protein
MSNTTSDRDRMPDIAPARFTARCPCRAASGPRPIALPSGRTRQTGGNREWQAASRPAAIHQDPQRRKSRPKGTNRCDFYTTRATRATDHTSVSRYWPRKLLTVVVLKRV